MTATPEAPRRRRWWRAGLVLLLLAGFAGGAAYYFREDLRDEWALRKFRRAAASDSPELPQLQTQLLQRLLADEVKLDTAVRLAEDPDPKVRAAAVDVLLANQPRAKKQDVSETQGAMFRGGSWRTRVEEAIKRLLKDDDETVRKKAIKAVAELAWADGFGKELRGALASDVPEERVIAASGLANWDSALLREVIADPARPDEVRIAAMQSLDTYGNKNLSGWRDELTKSLVAALQSGNADVRRAAIAALRHGERSAAVWLDVLCDERHKELHPHALKTWTDALGNDSSRGGHWSDAHDAWYRSTSSTYRCAVAGHVLCEAAKLQIQLLEQSPVIGEMPALRDRLGPTGRAFDVQLTRLGNVLSVVSAARWYCGDVIKAPDLLVRLPHEAPNGAPLARDPKALLFVSVRPVWEWCLARKGGYATRFLGGDAIVKTYASAGGPNPPEVRPLGTVLDELLIGQTDYDRLRAQYGPPK